MTASEVKLLVLGELKRFLVTYREKLRVHIESGGCAWRINRLILLNIQAEPGTELKLAQNDCTVYTRVRPHFCFGSEI